MSDTKPESSTDATLVADPNTIIDVDPKAGEGGYFRVNSDGDLIIGNANRGTGGRALVVNVDGVAPKKGLVINYGNDFGSVSIQGVGVPTGSTNVRSLMIDTASGKLFHEP